jgi:hypothetical protein
MIFLNAGNLWDNEYLDTVIQWNEEFKDKGIQVASLFGSIAKLTPTARSADRLPYRDWNFIDRYIYRMKEAGIQPRYTLNQSCIESIQDFHHNWNNKLRDDIMELHNVGVREWTVTSPLLVELLVDMFPDDFIEISTITEVSTPEDAERWMRLGADGVNISTSINRDFEAIRRIITSGIKTSILANEACLFRCPWRRECYNLSSHDSLRSEELFGFYPFRRCNEVRLEHPEEWISSRMVLPQWMKTYQEKLPGLDWFKVAFRTHPKEVALPILRAYMEQKFYGNYCDLWPTIAHLGNTPEPREMTYISTSRLDSLGVLSHFIAIGDKCGSRVCGVDCNYCKLIYVKSIPTPKK